MLVPLVAALVLVGIHAYLGVHVIARGVIFVDLALAQMAALGYTGATLAGIEPGSDVEFRLVHEAGTYTVVELRPADS